MDSDPTVSDLVEPLRADVMSGASVLSRTAADVLRRAAIRIQAGSLEELRWGLGEVCGAVLDAQPSMAPLVSLVRDVMVAVRDADSLEHGRHSAAAAADAFRGTVTERIHRVAEAAAEVLPVGGTVVTVSSSSTVRLLLESEAVPRGITVLCFESRPMNEGRDLASALAARGVDVAYAVDAAAHRLVPACEAVVMGADSVGDRGVVNKIGSALIALTAHSAGVPVHVLADQTKILPRGFPQGVDDVRPGVEVWDAPPGVDVWNHYFEPVPLQYVTTVVTESGPMSPDDFERSRAAIEFPAGLRAWVLGRERTAD